MAPNRRVSERERKVLVEALASIRRVYFALGGALCEQVVIIDSGDCDASLKRFYQRRFIDQPHYKDLFWNEAVEMAAIVIAGGRPIAEYTFAKRFGQFQTGEKYQVDFGQYLKGMEDEV